jgi:hypothetical protein
MSRERFCREVVFRLDTIKGDIPLPKMIIGHSLPFDLGALALEWGLARGDMYGALSLRVDDTLVPVRDEKHDHVEKLNAISDADPKATQWRLKNPAVTVRKVGPSKHLYGWKYPVNPRLEIISFVDTIPLARAVASPPSASLGALCEFFKFGDGDPVDCGDCGPPKPDDDEVEHFKPLTRAYLGYCNDDVNRGWFVFRKLREAGSG